MTFQWPVFSGFFECGTVPGWAAAGRRTGQGRATRGGGQALRRSHASRLEMGPGDGRRIVRRPAGMRQPISGSGCPRSQGSVSGGAQAGVDLAGDIALEAADDLCLRQALCGAPLDVGAGRGMGAHPRDHDPPQGVIGLAVAAGVEAMAGALARGSRDRGGSAQMRPGRLGPQLCRVVSGSDQEQGGGVGADAVQGEQAGSAGGDEGTISSSRRSSWPSRNCARLPARAARSGWRSRRCCRDGAAVMRSLPPGRLRGGGRTGSAGHPARSRSGTWPG
jgi:hypothetical protein